MGLRGHNAARSGTGEVGFQRRSTAAPTCDELSGSEGVRWVGQFVSDADMAVESVAMAMQPGDVAAFHVDDQGCSTGGLTFITIDDGADPGDTVTNLMPNQHMSWVHVDADGSKHFGSTVPAPGTVADDRPWTWETIAEDIDPDVAAMLQDAHGSVGAALAAWAATPPADRRRQVVDHLTRTGTELQATVRDEIRWSGPIGYASPIPGLSPARPGQVVVSVPTGSTLIYRAADAPAEATLKRWRELYDEGGRRQTKAFELRPSLVASSSIDELAGCTLGNRSVVDGDRLLRSKGMLSDAEWIAGASLRAFWDEPGRDDDAWPMMTGDGSIVDAREL